MPRTCSSGSTDRLYDSAANIADIEKTISKTMMLCGLNPENINTITIDEIIDAIRSTFPIDKSDSSEAGHQFIGKIHQSIIKEARWAWFDYQIAKYASTR